MANLSFYFSIALAFPVVPAMVRPAAGKISIALFCLALLEVWAWSLPVVHSAVGGSTSDLRGYYTRETANTAEVDNSVVHYGASYLKANEKADENAAAAKEAAEFVTRQQRAELAQLTSQMSMALPVRRYYYSSLRIGTHNALTNEEATPLRAPSNTVKALPSNHVPLPNFIINFQILFDVLLTLRLFFCS